MVTLKYSTDNLVCTLEKDKEKNTMYYLICEKRNLEVPVCIWYNPNKCDFSYLMPDDYNYIYGDELTEIFIWLRDEYPVLQNYLLIKNLLSEEN